MVKKKKKRILKVLKADGTHYRKIVPFAIKSKVQQKGEKAKKGLESRRMYDPETRTHKVFRIAKL